MKAIKPGLMPHLVTLYNVFISPATGEPSYFRTFLKRTRIMSFSSSVRVETGGWTRVVTSALLVDPRTTQGYRHGTKGIRIPKRYLDPPAWDKLPPEDKERFWTLKEGDLIVHLVNNGESTIDPDLTSAEFQVLAPRKIGSIKSEPDKRGRVHHWELGLV